MSATAVNRLFVRVGLLRAPSEPVRPALGDFLPGEICTSDPDKRVSRAFMGDARPPLGHAHGIAPLPARPAGTQAPRWNADQYARFSAQVSAYLAQNDTLIPHHAAWHELNGPGGTRGPGSGLAFLQMHHEMVVDLSRFISVSGRDADLVPLAEWRPSQPVPQGLAAVERYSTDPHIATPSWLTLAGGSEAAPIVGYSRLADFKNPDELGRALASGAPNNLGYHGAGHASVGGLMWSARAPQDPIFWLWHNHIDNIVTTWTSTANGRAWLATDDGQRWQTATGHHHHAVPGDPVAIRTAELLRMRDTNPAQYTEFLSRSSFGPSWTPPWPADALPITVESSQRFTTLGVTVQTLLTNLDLPKDLTFARNGDLYFTERGGRIRVVRAGVLQAEPVARLPNASELVVRQVGDGTVVSGSAYPQWQGRYVAPIPGDDASAARGLQLFDRGTDSTSRTGQVLFRDVFGRIGGVVQGPDGYLYLTTQNRDGRGTVGTSDDQILRIVPSAAR